MLSFQSLYLAEADLTIAFPRGPVVSLKAISRRPQAQARILDKIHFFSRYSIPTLRQLGRIVQLHHLAQLSVFEARTLHLFACQMSRTPGDAESPLARSMRLAEGSAWHFSAMRWFGRNATECMNLRKS